MPLWLFSGWFFGTAPILLSLFSNIWFFSTAPILLFLFSNITPILADVLPVDEARPFLSSDGGNLQWPSGGAAFLLSSTPLVRVNARGIFTEPKQAVLRGDLASAGWSSAPCNASAFALCTSASGHVFPLSRPVTGEGPHAWSGLRCGDAEGKVLTSDAWYDVTACDVVDEGLDVVFSRHLVWWRRTSLPAASYAALLAAAAFIVRGLSVNLQAGRPTEPQAWLVAACAACAGVVLVDGDAVYVTESDQVFFWCTLLYCLAYSAYHAYQLYGVPAPRPVYNLAAGTLQLVACRLYAGSESPYNPAVLFIIGSRALTKLRSQDWSQVGTSILDAVYLSLMCELAFLPDARYLVALFAACYLHAGRHAR